MKVSIQKSIFFAKNLKKFVYYKENMNFQTQLSRKLQRFRTCRKNKKCSIFHELSEYQQKGQLFSWSFHFWMKVLKFLDMTKVNFLLLLYMLTVSLDSIIAAIGGCGGCATGGCGGFGGFPNLFGGLPQGNPFAPPVKLCNEYHRERVVTPP